MHRTIALSHQHNLSLFNSGNVYQEGGDGPTMGTQQHCWDTGGGRGGSSR